MPRLDLKRKKELEPKRIQTAIKTIEDMGIVVDYQDMTKIKFNHNGCMITFFPYSGWNSGTGIKDGRGLKNLIKQLH